MLMYGLDVTGGYSNADTSPVGTDLSRPLGLSIAEKDVINRSLQISVAKFIIDALPPVR